MVRHMSFVNGLTSYQPTVAHQQWGYHQMLMYTRYMLRYEINLSLICQTERHIVRKPVSICMQQSADQLAYLHSAFVFPCLDCFIAIVSIYMHVCNFIPLTRLGQSFFIFRFTDPPDPIIWNLKKKIKEIFFQFYFFISLRLMPVQYWSSVMFFRFVFSIAVRLIKLPPVTAPSEILPF